MIAGWLSVILSVPVVMGFIKELWICSMLINYPLSRLSR